MESLADLDPYRGLSEQLAHKTQILVSKQPFSRLNVTVTIVVINPIGRFIKISNLNEFWR